MPPSPPPLPLCWDRIQTKCSNYWKFIAYTSSFQHSNFFPVSLETTLKKIECLQPFLFYNLQPLVRKNRLLQYPMQGFKFPRKRTFLLNRRRWIQKTCAPRRIPPEKSIWNHKAGKCFVKEFPQGNFVSHESSGQIFLAYQAKFAGCWLLSTTLQYNSGLHVNDLRWYHWYLCYRYTLQSMICVYLCTTWP